MYRANLMGRVKALVCVLLLASADIACANCTIYVTDNGDANPPFWNFGSGSDNKVIFREAVEIAKGVARCYSGFETGRIVGGNFVHDPVFCGTIDNNLNWRLSISNPGCGPNDADTIKFWDNINGGSQITLAGFVTVDPRDSIDGIPSAPGLRPNVELQGAASCPSSQSGAIEMGDLLNPVDATGSITNLYVTGFCGNAIWAPRTNGFRVSNVVFSAISNDPFAQGDALVLGQYFGTFDSNQKCVFSAQIGGTGPNEQNYFYNIAGDAISLWDTCTGDLSNRNNKIFNNYIGMCEALDTGIGLESCADGTPNQGIGRNGVYIRDANGTQVGGPNVGEGNYIARSVTAGVNITGSNSSGNMVRGNRIGVARQADFSRPNGTGVLIAGGADNNLVGGTGAGESNTISSNTSRAVTIDGIGTSGNRISGNTIGMNTARTQTRPNGEGVGISNSADTTQVDHNIIAANNAWGIYVNAGGAQSIHDNTIGLRGSGNNANDNTAAPNGSGGIWINDVGGNTVGPVNRIAGNNGPGVQVTGENADGNVIRANIIGLDNANASRANAGAGVIVFGGSDNTVIGGTTTADRNIVSGNSDAGIRINGNTTDATTIEFNFVGTDPLGNSARANGAEGIRVDAGASHVTISRNLVSGNVNDGIKLESGALQNHVQLNQVGLGNTSNSPLPNGASGISILSGATNNFIGDPVIPFTFNIIAGNAGAGIFVADSGTTDNVISGNFIGAAGVPNATGITVTSNAVRTQILANEIQGNTGSGVAVSGTGTVNNPIFDNLFDGNGGLGIDLGGNGVTPNDNGDVDAGPNNLQNFPTIGNVVIGNNSTSMSVSLNSIPNQGYTLTLYRSDHCDPSGFGEGQVKLGSINVTTMGNGSGGEVGLVYAVPNSQTQSSWGSAIATSAAGDTSEFGPCIGISDEIFSDNFE